MHGARRLAVCVVVAMLVGSLNGQVSNPAALASLQPTLRELIWGLADARPFAPRLAALPNWSSCEPLRSANGSRLAAECADGVSPSRAVWRIGHGIENEARKRPSGETLYALGLWRLLSASRLVEADLAVSSLRQASAYLPASGEVWNDLAVAYYVRGDRRGNPEDFVRSLAACDRSLQANPGLRAALFNRALALAALYVRGESARAWQRFLLTGDSPEWKREARRRLESSVMPERPRARSLSSCSRRRSSQRTRRSTTPWQPIRWTPSVSSSSTCWGIQALRAPRRRTSGSRTWLRRLCAGVSAIGCLPTKSRCGDR